MASRSQSSDGTASPDMKAIRVAVVDDYLRVAKVVGKYVRSMGCTVSVYTDPREFLQSMEKEYADAPVWDPGTTADDLLRRAR